MDIRYTESLSDVTRALEYAKVSGLFLDLETTGLDPRRDSIVHVVVASGPRSAIVFPPREDLLHVVGGSRPSFICCHNIKFDLAFLHNAGIDMRKNCTVFRDTMLIQHLLHEEGPFALDDLIQGRWNDPYKDRFWSKYKNYSDAPLDEQVQYAAKDVVYMQDLYHELLKEYKAELMPENLIEHTHRLCMALYDTEVVGVKIDMPYMAAVGADLLTRSNELFTKLNIEAGAYKEAVEYDLYCQVLATKKTEPARARVKVPEFNWNSQKQLQTLFYDKMGLPKQMRNRKVTTDDDALAAIESRSPVVALLREYRGYKKTYGTYIEGTAEKIFNGRVYPKFNINGTVTGRISSSNPNWQNVPSTGGVRGIYVPDDGLAFLSADQAQLEVVVAAHYSQDPNLLKVIYEGASKHDITAASMGVERKLAKTLNFAAQYLCSGRKFASILGCSVKEGDEALAKYWETYAGEKSVVDQCKQAVDDGEPIVNIMGRRRRFPQVFDTVWEREAAYRAAYSALIQGSGADLVHEGCYLVSEKLRELGLGRVIAEIHDELVIEFSPDKYDIVAEIVKTGMEAPASRWGLTVPLTAQIGPPMQRWEK